MDDLSEAFLAHHERIGSRPNTIASLRRTLKSVDNAGTATMADLQTWWEARIHLSKGTRANDHANLSSFYKWCAEWDERPDNPLRRIKAPKVAKGIPRPLPNHEVEKLVDKLAPDLRRAIILGAYAGLRVSEAAALMWKDVDVESSDLHIIESKGTKSRVVAVAPIVIDDLLPNTGGNVVTGTDEVLSATVLQRRTSRAMRAWGVDGTFHQLRHRYGSRTYQKTGDLVTIAEQMGHSSIETTRVYAQGHTDAARRVAMAAVR